MNRIPLRQRLLLATLAALAFVGNFALTVLAPLGLSGGLA